MNNKTNTEIRVTAPGRVNLIGEHVDYNAGPVLPAAINRHVKLSAKPVDGSVVSLHAESFNEQVSFDLRQLERKVTLDGSPLPAWALYPAGVAWALQETGFPVRAVSASYNADIPIGAGLSSSAAVESAFAILWRTLGGWEADRMLLAQICLKAEIEYIGVDCGLMDQFICLHGIQGHALYFDTRSLEWEAIRMPEVGLVIANSNVPHRLAESAYNERRNACRQAVLLLQQQMPHIQALRDVTVEAFERHAALLPETIRKRARHVVEECGRVEQAAICLKSGDLLGFGRLMLAGHASLRDLYAVSSPELDLLVEIASGLPGCWGARLTGAGFGGCTVNLVALGHVEPFMETLAEEYHRRSGRTADIFVTQPVEGTRLEGCCAQT